MSLTRQVSNRKKRLKTRGFPDMASEEMVHKPKSSQRIAVLSNPQRKAFRETVKV
jgi:hypothetical protein